MQKPLVLLLKVLAGMSHHLTLAHSFVIFLLCVQAEAGAEAAGAVAQGAGRHEQILPLPGHLHCPHIWRCVHGIGCADFVYFVV